MVWPGGEPPVLLLHPNRTNARVWDFAIAASEAPNRYLAMDYRGHGRSDYPSAGYTLDHHLADVAGVVEQVGLDRYVLVGAATGGNLGLLHASRFPAEVAGLVVADPGLSLDPKRSRRAQREILEEHTFPDLATARARLPHGSRWSEMMRDHVLDHSFQVLPDGSMVSRFYPPGVATTEAALEADIWDEIRVRCPTLVLRGAESPTFPSDRMERLVSMIPGARGVTVAGAGHRIAQDVPDRFAALLDDFLSDLS